MVRVKNIVNKGATLFVAGITATCFGLGGGVSADTSISNTGPDSTNTITTSVHSDCTISNSNNIGVSSTNNQQASSGDVTVDHNTNVGSGWGSWDPAVWQAQGHTYAEWHTAFMAYMTSQQTNWQNNWGSGNLGGGAGATSGSATNNANTSVSINIDNGGASASATSGACTPGMMPGSSSIGNTGPGSTNGVLGSSTSNTHVSNSNGILAASTNNQGASSGDVTTGFNTSAGGGSGSGGAGNNAGNGAQVGIHNGPSGGNGGGQPVPPAFPTASISNTGPDSTNTITFSNYNKTTITNTNNISSTSTNNQQASSGDVTISHNTSAGGGASGGANNGANNSTDVNIH